MCRASSTGMAGQEFRRAGFKPVRLPGLPWTREFMEAYELAMGGASLPPEIGSHRTKAGTINALVVAYYRSEAWQKLSPDTTRTHRRLIERFREQHGSKRVALLRSDHIQRMIGDIEGASHRRHWLQAIRKLLAAAVPTLRSDNPTDGIRVTLRKGTGFHTWTPDEIEQYRGHWALGTQQRLVMEFALETASRKGEIVRLGPQHIKDGRIKIERLKGSRPVDIPLTPTLHAAIDAMPRAHLTFIVTAAGAPRSKRGLGNDFAEWATAAGLPKRCRLHGLKKGKLTQLAEQGKTTHELMAVSGHRTLSELQRYTDAANYRRLAEFGHDGTGRQRGYCQTACPRRQTCSLTH
jgi:integrase